MEERRVSDLSKFNEIDDFLKLKAAVDAVVLRLGYRGAHTGTITYDPKYQEYMAACQKYNIPAMFYFFPCSITEKEAEAEANFIIAAAKKVKLCGPIWLDSEVVYQDRSGRSDNLSKANRTKYLNVILRKLHAAGYECGVYASKSWFANNLNDNDLEDFCLRWVAQWADKLTYTGHDVAMWQYTNNGSLPGVNGRVDLNRCYIALDGSKGTEAVAPSVTRQDIVDQICSWEGWSEANGKYRKIIDIYNYYLPTAVKSGTLNYTVKYSDEWCATAASAAYIQAGAPELFPIECGCPRNISLAKKMGIWVENDAYVPDPGDAVLYDWQDSGSGDNAGTPDHIGIVVDVNEKAGTFAVMEGNYNERVARRTMKINGRYIRGFICPKFNTTASTTTKASTTVSTTAKETKTVSKNAYEVSKTGTPNKTIVVKWGLLKNNQKVTPRLQPDESAKPCSFAPVQPLTKIEVYDYITTKKRWAYCKVGGKYGFILASSIRDYLRIPKQSMEKVVKWVMDDDFGTLETRENALKTLGYDVDAVQAAVNKAMGYEPSKNPRIRVWPVWFFEDDESRYGDCTAIIEYASDGKTVAHCILIDSAMAGCASLVVKKLKAAGVKKIDAFVLSHGHGDHYGGLSSIMSSIPVGHIYVPDVTGLAKYQSSYAKAIKRQAQKASSTYLKSGSSFQIGNIKCDCLFICPASKLSEHDSHHFVNNQSMVLRFTLDDTWTFYTAGDLQNEGNNVLIKTGMNLNADIYKCQWHGDANACNEAICKAVKPKVAFFNYHHLERSGRSTTRKHLEAIGAVVARNAENGDIYIDCQGYVMKLSCSKGNLSKTWTK